MVATDDFAVPAVVDTPARRPPAGGGLSRWLLRHQVQPVGPEADEGHAKPHAWWKVMCLTGVDYFSTPGLPARHRRAGRRGAVAAGDAADRGADPAGHAADVPAGGQGEPARAGLGGDAGGPAAVLAGQAVRAGPARLRRHLVDHHDHPVRGRRRRCTCWRTRSSPSVLHGHEVAITVVLLLLLGGVFLLGFSEAVSVAIPLVAVFLGLNAVIVVRRPGRGVHHRRARCPAWTDALTAGGGGFGGIAGPGAARLPAAGAGPVRVRDRGEHDAAGRRRRRRRASSGCARGSATPASCSPPPR